MAPKPYSKSFYDTISDGSRRSAAVVAPMVLDLLTDTESVVDLGSGQGWWMEAFADAGVPDVRGGDGPWVKEHVMPEQFTVIDLAKPTTVHLEPADLVVSLEVAEHLPSNVAADYVATLARHTTPTGAVLFSAAIPGQAGADHINCQWPRYWADLFAEHGFRLNGSIRWVLWDRVPEVEVWYVQNLFLAVRDNHPDLYEQAAEPLNGPIPLVHPAMWAWCAPI